MIADVIPTPKVFVALYQFQALHDEQLTLTPNDVIIAPSDIPINGWVKGMKQNSPGKVHYALFKVSYITNL